MFLFYDSTLIILLPAILFTMFAQARVSSAYARYAQVKNRTGMTGAEAARKILDQNDLSSVSVEMTPGRLTDHYDPRQKVMRLSPQVYEGDSIASVSIAAHESGHAIQHGKGYGPLSFRNTIAPAVSFASNVAWLLLVIGLFMGGVEGMFMFNLGILLFCFAVLFQAVTLPVELDASKRAIEQMDGLGIIYEDEKRGAKKVLSAAALTYVAALLTSLLNLVRLLAIRGRRNG